MNSKFLFLIIFIAVLAGVVGFGYWQATGPVANNPDAPKIEISPASYNFGEVEFGKIVNYTFFVKNTGADMLEIKRVATSCGCTTAEMSQQSIEPGQTAELLVVYDTGAMGDGTHSTGEQERIIYIKTNDPANPQVNAIISAYVK